MNAFVDRLTSRALKGTGVAVEGSEAAASAKFVVTTPSPLVAIKILTSKAYWIPEAFARGHWKLTKGDLGDFVTHMMDGADGGVMRSFVSHSSRRISLRHLWQHWITPKSSTRAVKNHYDIESRIYEHFLDAEMVYTAAFFEEADDLYAAQQAKLARITERLSLPKGARVLDIGCGWGALARHIVRNRPDVHVTGVTISEGQLNWALDHNAAHLTPTELARVELKLEDLRDHAPTEPYDAVVSVGLFEHVGRSLYGDFFSACARYCRPDGTVLMHTIVKNRSNIATNAWIDRHIFPGGYIASVAEIAQASEQAELDMDSVFLHAPMNYGTTCRAWRHNLMKNRDAILEIYRQDYGFSADEADHAYRTWEIYLAGAEAGFFVKRRPMQTAQFRFSPTGSTSIQGQHDER